MPLDPMQLLTPLTGAATVPTGASAATPDQAAAFEHLLSQIQDQAVPTSATSADIDRPQSPEADRQNTPRTKAGATVNPVSSPIASIATTSAPAGIATVRQEPVTAFENLLSQAQDQAAPAATIFVASAHARPVTTPAAGAVTAPARQSESPVQAKTTTAKSEDCSATIAHDEAKVVAAPQATLPTAGASVPAGVDTSIEMSADTQAGETASEEDRVRTPGQASGKSRTASRTTKTTPVRHADGRPSTAASGATSVASEIAVRQIALAAAAVLPSANAAQTKTVAEPAAQAALPPAAAPATAQALVPAVADQVTSPQDVPAEPKTAVQPAKPEDHKAGRRIASEPLAAPILAPAKPLTSPRAPSAFRLTDVDARPDTPQADRANTPAAARTAPSSAEATPMRQVVQMPAEPEMVKAGEGPLPAAPQPVIAATADSQASVMPASAPQPAAQAMPAPAVPATPNVPAAMSQAAIDNIGAMSLQIQKKLSAQSTRFALELKPADLGKVEVAVTIGRDGKMTAHLQFDSPVTAAAFSAQEPELRQQLANTGLMLDGNALSFSSRDDTQQQSPRGNRRPGRSIQAAESDDPDTLISSLHSHSGHRRLALNLIV